MVIKIPEERELERIEGIEKAILNVTKIYSEVKNYISNHRLTFEDKINPLQTVYSNLKHLSDMLPEDHIIDLSQDNCDFVKADQILSGALRFQMGNLGLDGRARQFFYKDQPLQLEKTSYNLLSVLMGNVNRLMTREQLLECLNVNITNKDFKSHIYRLRQDLEKVGIDGKSAIKTVLRRGYRLSFNYFTDPF